MHAYSWERTMAPLEQTLTLAEVKRWLRIDDELTDDDELLEELIKSAARYTEAIKSLALTTQKWTLYMDLFPSVIEIRKRPVSAVTAIKYIDSAGTLQTLDPASYHADLTAFIPKIAPSYGSTWPSGRCEYHGVRVELTCGYGPAAAVPAQIKAGLCLAVGHLYENRESTVIKDFELVEMPMGYHHLCGSEAIINV